MNFNRKIFKSDIVILGFGNVLFQDTLSSFVQHTPCISLGGIKKFRHWSCDENE